MGFLGVKCKDVLVLAYPSKADLVSLDKVDLHGGHFVGIYCEGSRRGESGDVFWWECSL